MVHLPFLFAVRATVCTHACSVLDTAIIEQRILFCAIRTCVFLNLILLCVHLWTRVHLNVWSCQSQFLCLFMRTECLDFPEELPHCLFTNFYRIHLRPKSCFDYGDSCLMRCLVGQNEKEEKRPVYEESQCVHRWQARALHFSCNIKRKPENGKPESNNKRKAAHHQTKSLTHSADRGFVLTKELKQAFFWKKQKCSLVEHGVGGS